MSNELVPPISESESADCGSKASHALQIVGWFSAGLAFAVLSIYVGVEIRSRYLFSKRTPYDFYSNVGEQPAGEFGMGI
jgi:hypothetical protein